MDPMVCSSLFATDDVSCLVIHAWIPIFWVFVFDGWPYESPSLFGSNVNPQFSKSRCTTFFNIRQIQKEGHDSMPGWSFILPGGRIVMHPVELVFVILQDLKRFVIFLGHPRDAFDFFRSADHSRHFLAFSCAPSIIRGSRFRHDFFHFSKLVHLPLIGRTIESCLFSTLPDLIGFKIRQKGIEGNNPRAIDSTKFRFGGTHYIWCILFEFIVGDPLFE
mmetsp:Transcript_16869/g.34797  ORF Transcript_16869/g.34797 Transcript_16869/m.34797 type:complete len:219 (+) Transcript_16869:175-831(+)